MYGMSESGDNGDELGMRKGSEEGRGNDGCGERGGCRGEGEKMGDERLVS
jgi:hypothetical protein